MQNHFRDSCLSERGLGLQGWLCRPKGFRFSGSSVSSRQETMKTQSGLDSLKISLTTPGLWLHLRVKLITENINMINSYTHIIIPHVYIFFCYLKCVCNKSENRKSCFGTHLAKLISSHPPPDPPWLMTRWPHNHLSASNVTILTCKEL